RRVKDLSLEDQSLRDQSLRDQNLEDQSLGDKSLGDKSLGDRGLGDKSLGDKSLEDPSFEVLQMLPKFCFPFDVESQVGQNFSFVLTDIDSKQRFGFCRLNQGCRICICLLSPLSGLGQENVSGVEEANTGREMPSSVERIVEYMQRKDCYLPWFEIYYKLLNTLADYLTKHQESDLNDMLNSLYDMPVPTPYTPVNLNVHSYFIAPDINGLPTIPESRNLTEYFVAVDTTNMLQLYASMLHERRIIVTSSKLSTPVRPNANKEPSGRLAPECQLPPRFLPPLLLARGGSFGVALLRAGHSSPPGSLLEATSQLFRKVETRGWDEKRRDGSYRSPPTRQASLTRQGPAFTEKRLTACVHGAAAMLYPMYWQHIFIPRVLSRSLEDVVILNNLPTDVNLPSDVARLMGGEGG
ncbi:hypothetical protein NHX12_033663, partial [Muraenolepis orangiensis]